MDFLVARGFRPVSEDKLFHFQQRSLEGWLPTYINTVAGTQILAVGETVKSKEGEWCFDGSVVADDIFLTNFRPGNAQGFSQILNNSEEMSGSFTIARISDDGAVEARIDAMSQYILFYYRDSGKRFVISNNIYFIEEFFALNGISQPRRVEPYIAAMVWGAANFGGSGVENVEILGHRQYLVSRGDELRVRSLQMRESADYGEAIERAAASIERNVKVIGEAVNSNPNLRPSFDVTGGKDSRMVFAALVKCGLHRDFEYRSIRPFPDPDGHYAAFVHEQFGLRARHYEERDPNPVNTYVDSELLLYEGFMSVGLGPRHGMVGSVREPLDVHLHGGFGEFGGSSPDVKRSVRPGSGNKSLADLLGNYVFKTQRLNILDYLSKKGQQFAIGNTKYLFSILGDELESPSQVPLQFYNRGRARAHFALISWMRGRAYQYPDVLHTKYLSEAASFLTPDEMAEGKVSFDIIYRLGGRSLVSLPLIGKPWADLVDPTNIAGRGVITRTTPPMFQNEIKRNSRRSAWREIVDPRGREIAQSLRQTFYYQQYVKEALDAGSPITEWFDADRLRSVTNKLPTEVTKDDYRALSSSAFAAVWVARIEKPFQIVNLH